MTEQPHMPDPQTNQAQLDLTAEEQRREQRGLTFITNVISFFIYTLAHRRKSSA